MTVDKPILILTAGGLNPDLLINALAQRFDNIQVIEEQPESKLEILKRRSRLCGPLSALGQMATMIVSRLSKTLAKSRIAQIIEQHNLSPEPPRAITRHHVGSINSDECLALIKTSSPAVIFTVSCRIVKKRVLAQIPCPVINLHAGINPAYRGQMGGYWSRIASDEANFGATIHLVDHGIDTGATLYEVRTKPQPNDTIATYPLLLTAVAIEPSILAIEDALQNRLKPRLEKQEHSQLRYPPTLWTWIWNGLTKGIW